MSLKAKPWIRGAKNKTVLKYLDRFYPGQFCALCGNHGIIDTRGVKSPNGIEAGVRNFCLCANGQAMRREFETIERFDEQEEAKSTKKTDSNPGGETPAQRIAAYLASLDGDNQPMIEIENGVLAKAFGLPARAMKKVRADLLEAGLITVANHNGKLVIRYWRPTSVAAPQPGPRL